MRPGETPVLQRMKKIQTVNSFNPLVFISALCIFFFFGCLTKDNKIMRGASLATKKMILYVEDTAGIEIPYRQFVGHNLARLMELEQISSGVDGYLLRIWLSDQKVTYVVTAKLNDSGNKLSVTAFHSLIVDSTEFVVIDNEWKDLRPASGWQNFANQLKKYQIPSLSEGNLDKKHGFLTHMTNVIFEVASPGQYKYYEYLEPSYYKYVDSISNNVFQFLTYLNKDLKIEVYKLVDGASTKHTNK